jgi:hypothetical protein
MRAFFRVLSFACVAVALEMGPAPASAQTSACPALQQQYLAAVRSPASALPSRASLEAAARANNCNSFGFFAPRPTAACPAIMSQLRAVQGQANPFAFFGGATYSRSSLDQILYAMAVNRCSIPSGSTGGGGGRTLCVRTCDGYYFPISAAAPPSKYQSDAQVCESIYGGGGASELYVASSRDDVAGARSLKGDRYGDQSYAFAYRAQFDAECAATLHEGMAALATTAGDIVAPVTVFAPAGATPLIVMPRMRPRASEDPETLVNRDGDLLARPPAEQPLIARTSEGIRMVGADYYYELVLRAGSEDSVASTLP